MEAKRLEIFAKQKQQMGAAFGTSKPKRPKTGQGRARRASLVVETKRQSSPGGHGPCQSSPAQGKERAKLSTMTRKEQIAYQRTQKRQQLQADREASKNKREKLVKPQYYGILGLNSLAGDGQSKDAASKDSQANQVNSLKSQFGMDERAFGLPTKLFYTKAERDSHYGAFLKV